MLAISPATLYRWRAIGGMPRAAHLVLASVASGQPVLPFRSHQWADHRFGPDGALYTPTGYPIYPGDLWLFEFAQRNGLLRIARAWSRGLHDGRPVPSAANQDPPESA